MRRVNDWTRGTPEVVAARKRLEARADTGVTVVPAELHGLVDVAIAVAQVGGLRPAEVEAQTLFRAAVERDENKCGSVCAGTYKPMALAKFVKPSSVSTEGELRPEIMT
jgi:transcriptional regulator GlxA family with amidase domain